MVFRAGVFTNWLALARRQRNKVKWQLLFVFPKRSEASKILIALSSYECRRPMEIKLQVR
jgi:hypothetical protein